MVDPSEPRKCSNGRRSFQLHCLLAAVGEANPAFAEDWGAYSIVPAAPRTGAGSVGSGTNEGTEVSLGRARRDGQPEMGRSTPKGNNLLFHQAVLQLEPRAGCLARRREDRHAHRAGNGRGPSRGRSGSSRKTRTGRIASSPGMPRKKAWIISAAIPNRGPRSTCGRTTPGDQHLEWMIKPLAGSTTQASGAASGDATRAPTSRPRSSPESRPQGRDQGMHVLRERHLPGHRSGR